MQHDPFCPDHSVLLAGKCVGCEQALLIRIDTARLIEQEIEGDPGRVFEVLRKWREL